MNKGMPGRKPLREKPAATTTKLAKKPIASQGVRRATMTKARNAAALAAMQETVEAIVPPPEEQETIHQMNASTTATDISQNVVTLVPRPPKAFKGTLGSRIYATRVKRNMTQADLAKPLDVTRVSVSQWEHDLSALSLPRVQDIAGVLGVSSEFLLFGDNSHEPVAGTAVISEVVIGDSPTSQTEMGTWTFPERAVRDMLRQADKDMIVWEVQEPNMAPDFGVGDRVVVDVSARRPANGVFLHWSMGQPCLNQFSLVPAGSVFKVRVTSKDGVIEPYEMLPDDVQIIGRVKAHIRKV